MWEKLKENGYGLASVGVIGANLVIFVIIAIRGTALLFEPNRWILTAEISICSLLLLWGIERLGKDWFERQVKRLRK